MLSSAFLRRFIKKANIDQSNIKSALGKVLGMLDAEGRYILIDRNVPKPRLTFLKLHEAGHGTIPHQSKIYRLIHDSEQSLDPEITELFEREANVFAAEVQFQGERFAQEARDLPIGIAAQLELAKKFGASNYATMRRFAATTAHACCLVVLEPPVRDRDGTRIAHVRRIVASAAFAARFEPSALDALVEPGHPLAPALPATGKRLTVRREVVLRDRNGQTRICASEAFDSTHQILVLLWSSDRVVERG